MDLVKWVLRFTFLPEIEKNTLGLRLCLLLWVFSSWSDLFFSNLHLSIFLAFFQAQLKAALHAAALTSSSTKTRATASLLQLTLLGSFMIKLVSYTFMNSHPKRAQNSPINTEGVWMSKSYCTKANYMWMVGIWLCFWPTSMSNVSICTLQLWYSSVWHLAASSFLSVLYSFKEL